MSLTSPSGQLSLSTRAKYLHLIMYASVTSQIYLEDINFFSGVLWLARSSLETFSDMRFLWYVNPYSIKRPLKYAKVDRLLLLFHRLRLVLENTPFPPMHHWCYPGFGVVGHARESKVAAYPRVWS